MGGQGSGRRPYKHLTRVGVPGPAKGGSEAPVDDPDGIFTSYDEMRGQADGSLDSYRELHRAALICHQNGYNVRFHALPYLMALSSAAIDAKSQRERNRLSGEIKSVYEDIRDWRGF